MSRETFAVQTNVSRETLDRLQVYADRLMKWNRAINLVAKPTLNHVWTRHFLDSAQLLDHVPGAGFPGLVIAILRPDISVTLVESDQRKSVFLNEVARATETEVTILCQRAEDIDLKANIVSARALSSLSQLLHLADPLLLPDGVCLFLKGENVENELTEANRLWHIDHEQYDSRVDLRGTLLSVTDFHRRTGA